MKKKIIAAVLVAALALSMTSVAFANPSPAGIELQGATTPPTIPPDTDPDFPPMANLADGLDFGSIAVATVNTASANVVRNSMTHSRTAAGEEIGLRTRSAVNFNVQVTLTGFRADVGGTGTNVTNTLPGAFMNFTATGATAVTATGASGGYNRADGGWQSLPLTSPNTFTLMNPNLMAGTGTTAGSAVTVVEGRSFAGVEMLWGRNLVGLLNILPNTALAAGETTATMTWTVIPA